MINQRYGRLIVIAEAGRDKGRNRLWECRCDCGSTIKARGFSLKSGRTQSCGCLMREVNAQRIKARSITHNHSYTSTYHIWRTMRDRCYNPSSKVYPRYGGRGIEVCERWRQSFAAFLEDMGERPHGLSIERRDNNGNYSPENCYWATTSAQRRNRRDGLHNITFRGRTMPMKDWAEHLNIPYKTLAARLNDSQWPIEKALTTRLLKNYRRNPC